MAMHFSSRISKESLFFAIAHLCLTNTARPEEDRSLAIVWELTELFV